MQNQTKPESIQDSFNRAYRHFILQGNPVGYDKLSGQCLYRTRDGKNGCAIGCQLPDALVSAEVLTHNGQIADVLKDFTPIYDWFSDVLVEGGGDDFLRELQLAHDHVARSLSNAKQKQLMTVEFTKVAKQFNLTIPTE